MYADMYTHRPQHVLGGRCSQPRASAPNQVNPPGSGGGRTRTRPVLDPPRELTDSTVGGRGSLVICIPRHMTRQALEPSRHSQSESHYLK
jgi:hypothetical protein